MSTRKREEILREGCNPVNDKLWEVEKIHALETYMVLELSGLA